LSARKSIDLDLTGYDELFMYDEGRAEAKLPRIYDIPLDLIDDFPNHPFRVRLDEDMD
jgi:ParB family chromosome partitioning protein